MLHRLWLFIACLMPASLSAGVTPIPEFNGGHLYVAGVDNLYAPVQAEIDRLQSASPQTYYVVVVRSSGTGTFATKNYIDDLYAAWRKQASQQGLKLDVDRSVIVVLAIENRQLSVHMGQKLHDELGLRGQVIDRELVTPKFLPYARNGNYVEGLTTLLGAIDQRVVSQEAAQTRQREEAQARAAQLRQDAQAAVAGAKQLQTDVQRELDAKKQTGFSGTTTAARLADAGKQVTAAEKLLAESPAKALAEAQAATGTLQDLQGELNRLAALEHDADAALKQAEAKLHQADDAIEKLGRQGLAVAPLQTQFDQQAAALEQARKSLDANPAESLQQARQADGNLVALLDATAELPDLREKVHQQSQAVGRLHESVANELKQATAAGVHSTEIERQRVAMEQVYKEGDGLENVDYATAMAKLDDANHRLITLQREIRSKADEHYYVTRTLPIGGGLAVAATVGLVVLGRWWMHVWRKRSVAAELQMYKDQVVQLSDTLDALKERHKLLPFTDTDFIEPMTGETLTLYNSAQEAIGRFRQRWLDLMDAWERAQHLLEAAGPLSLAHLNKAREALVEAHVADELAAIQQDCSEPLDRLNQAHENAQEMLTQADTDSQRLAKQLEAVQAAQLSVAPYQPELDAATALTDRGRGMLKQDPIGAQGNLEQAGKKIQDLGRLTEAVMRHWRGTGEVETRQRETAELAQKRRAEGYLLVEEGGNPDSLLAAALDHRNSALDDLNRAQADAAAGHLKQAFQCLDGAHQAIDGQVSARTQCEAEIPARAAETERLHAAVSDAAAILTQLDREFAAESWHGVSANSSQAQSLLDQCRQCMAEARTACDTKVQHYFRAAALLKQVHTLQQQAAALIAAVGQRQRELYQVRDKCRSQIPAVRELAERVGELLRTNTADRPRSNQRYQAARQVLEQAQRQAGEPRVDWSRVQSQLDEARTGLEKAGELAREDLRLADQAAAEIADAQRAIHEASSWYQHGFTANVSSAESQLSQARMNLQSQSYETAITQAGVAQQAARAALDEAQRKALAKQMEIEQARRQREAARANDWIVPAAIAVNTISNMASSSHSHTHASQPSSPATHSTSSVSSWESGSSQTSW